MNFKPVSEVVINDFIRIAAKSWPKDYYREIEDIEVIKEFYNISYGNFHNEINILLNEFHPASWVRIAYVQLELWTIELFEHHTKKTDISKPPFLFIPIARYGWRYILEISLEKMMDYDYTIYTDERPTDKEISKIFTLLIGLSYCNELSNYIHYFKEHFKNAKIIFSESLYSRFPFSDQEEKNFFENLILYLYEPTDFNLVPEFDYRNNPEILARIDNFLKRHFNFTIIDIDVFVEILRDKITPHIGATNLIIPTDELVILISEISHLEKTTISGIIDFVFFDTNTFNYEKRNFLQRSQNVRMLNFAGSKFKLDNSLKTIYEANVVNLDYIRESKTHCIISFILLEEWKLNFISRLIYGQRSDLKSLNRMLNDDISKIEHYFHKNVFENAIKNLLINYDLKCISLEKIGKNEISCGEIDAISIDKIKKIIYVIEAKNTSPAKDARAFGRVISDHYQQKKYHSKFLLKIEWVQKNFEVLSDIFNIKIGEDFIVEKYFVTGSANPLKFLITEYNVMTYFEFYTLLNRRYEGS